MWRCCDLPLGVPAAISCRSSYMARAATCRLLDPIAKGLELGRNFVSFGPDSGRLTVATRRWRSLSMFVERVLKRLLQSHRATLPPRRVEYIIAQHDARGADAAVMT